ncbi:MAG: hypothetical protein B0D92_04830 [Spirochaeta sp. LUC14_002_19_P3]|nr:MAG: hypothetical protein B0D92_04830 [Spirochaeta sp. LUC14_002_19_P3]
MAKIVELFEAYKKDELPRERGFVITEHLNDSTRYARYEIISYANVKDIYPSKEGITFQSDGKKLYMLFEPLNYNAKHLEPIYRDEYHQIPLRFNELEVCSTTRQEKIMIAKLPIMTYTSFTVANPSGLNTSYIVHSDESSDRTILGFFEQSFWKTLSTSRRDAKAACEVLVKPLQMLISPEGL